VPVLALDLALPKFHSQKVALPGFSCGLCIQYNKNHFDSSLIFSVAPVRHFRLERNLKLFETFRSQNTPVFRELFPIC
jgi:hypothetical protein